MRHRVTASLDRFGWLQRLWLPLVGLCLLLVGPARGGNLPGELPALVGRLNLLAGDVQLQDRDSGRWDASPSGDAGPLRNWPVAAGDRLRLRGRDARAELRLGSTTLRLGAGAELWLQQLDGQGVLLQLQDGTLALRLAAADTDAFGPVEVRTREGRWLPRRPGHYRFDRESDATQASVWRGELQFEGFDSALTIPEGRRADLWLDGPEGGRRTATRYAWATVERDGFADWVARDERQDDAPQTARYVPAGMTGWQDLDRHGDWVPESDHGPLWLPRAVPVGWAPYQTGRWVWVSPWGWTWIDAAPWGFAPFHYGSWVRFDGRWAWSPGRGEPHWHGHRDPRVRFAPALSGWFSGPSVGISVQIGGQRPPPPRVVVPTVPVVVVRPVVQRPLPAPVVVVPARPERPADERRWDGPRRDDRHGDDRRGERRADDRRWEDRRDERRDDRRDERREERRDDRRDDHRDDRAGPRGDRRVDGPAERWQEPPRAGRPGRDAAPLSPAAAVPAVPVATAAPLPAPLAQPGARPPAPVSRTQPAAPVALTPAPAPVAAPAAPQDVPRMGVPRPPPRVPQVADASPTNPPRALQGGHETGRGGAREGGRAERPDRPDRPDRPERPDKGDRPDKGGPERAGGRDLGR